MEDSSDCKIGNFQTEGNVIMLRKHLDKSVSNNFFRLPSITIKIRFVESTFCLIYTP